jgi:predicted NBD/HSP70 family sugar kinase
VLGSRTVPLDIDLRAHEALDLADDLTAELLDETGLAREHVLAAGAALPAPLVERSGRVLSRGILPSWVDIEPRRELERRLGLPAHVDNDANLGALAEWELGQARGHEVVLYVRLSAGIGTGLLLGGRPYRGAHGMAGELGHIPVDRAGAICRCGNRGCLETLVAGPALTAPLRDTYGELDVPALIERAARGDSGCARVLSDAGTTIGQALAGVCTVLDPDLVLIGGELSGAGVLLIEPLRAAMVRDSLPGSESRIRVELGSFGDRAAVMGALSLAAEASIERLERRRTRSPA